MVKNMWLVPVCFFLATACNDSSPNNGRQVCQPNTTKRIFVSASTYDGNLGGKSGADSKCNSDANKPSGCSTYKAMLADGIYRIACSSANCITSGVSEHLDWVLNPNTSYYRTDETTLIGTTAANGVFTFPLTNAIDPAAGATLTSLNTDWTTGNSCAQFTSNYSGYDLDFGDPTSATNTTLNSNTTGCNSTGHLYCVEQ